MKTRLSILLIILPAAALFISHCNPAANNKETSHYDTTVTPNYGGYASREQWGEHLVAICSCNDCHTPKKFTDKGMVPDSSLLLSGHPANAPIPDVDRAAMEKKGNVITQTLTAWVGPWGVSYTANLTSDKTGIGNWEESNFFTAIRHGKFKGIESGRSLLPPMPWDMIRHMTDDELKAVFAFLKSTRPIENIVPPPQPPASAMAAK
jgi:hypothetical protein